VSGVGELRAVIVGCARDCAAHLPAALENARRIGSLFREASYIVVENDSVDGTKAILQRWRAATSNVTLVCLDGLARTAQRTLRLAVARNEYLRVLRRSALAQRELLIVLDLDDINAAPADLERVAEACALLAASPELTGVFANQRGTYFDMWALRHPERCPGDVWEEVFDAALATGGGDDRLAFERTFGARVFELEEHAAPLDVTSAFGGLGVYKVDRVVAHASPYSGFKRKLVSLGGEERSVGWQVCEHVSFNASLVHAGGALRVLPWLINADTTGLTFPPSAFRSLAF
jgi:hypothetical protein